MLSHSPSDFGTDNSITPPQPERGWPKAGGEGVRSNELPKPNEPTANSEKEKMYAIRAEQHQNISNQLKQDNNDALVLLQMNTKNGTEFYQTFNQDAELVAGLLNRKILQSGDNKYVSLTGAEIITLKEKLGEDKLVVEKFDLKTSFSQKNNAAPQQNSPLTKQKVPTDQNHPTAAEQVTASDNSPSAQKEVTSSDNSPSKIRGGQGALTNNTSTSQTAQNRFADLTPDSRIEYTINPVMRVNKETQQQERVPGMYALSIATEGQVLSRKTLTKEERDLLNTRPGEITNVINAKFNKELNGLILNFKQVHRPALPDEKWGDLTLPNGMTLDGKPYVSDKMMTIRLNGATLGPKQMYRPDVNDFFDHAVPLGVLAARVFREELKNFKSQTKPQENETPKMSHDDFIQIWHNARYGDNKTDNPQKLAFVQREGKYGPFFQTFNDDAKNMAKVTNRSVRVEDTETQKNVVYANVPEDQIDAVRIQLLKAGFQPFSVNVEGLPVPLAATPKNHTTKTISLADGRKVDDINLRNINGKWLMSANIEGKPLPQREITQNDAACFKQSQQKMSDILLKYYANDFKNESQQEQTSKRGIGR